MTLQRLAEKAQLERRRWPRIDIEGTCLLDQGVEKYKIRNIGPGGLRISSSAEFESGDKFRLQVSLWDGYQFATWAYVAWCSNLQEDSPETFEVGFKFIDLPKEDFQYIKNLIQY